MTDSSSCYVIGIDGGGSKTEAIALNCVGQVIATGLGGSVNTTFVSEHEADQSIRDALEGLARAGVVVGEASAVGSCFVGGRRLGEQVISDLGFFGPRFAYGEHDVAFRRAGLFTRTGIAVIAGTGSSFRGNNGERMESFGGWGMAVGDEGSGFDIGLKALKAAGRCEDGRASETRLLELLLAHSDSKTFHEVLSKYCRPSLKQREIAALARLVTQAAVDGDDVARQILTEAGDSLGSDVSCLARRLFKPDHVFDVVLSGGVFDAGEMVVRALRDGVTGSFPRARFHSPRMSAGEAVARLTLDSLRNSAPPSGRDTRFPA